MLLIPLGMRFTHVLAAALTAAGQWLRRLADQLRHPSQSERCPRPHRADEQHPPDFPPPFY